MKLLIATGLYAPDIGGPATYVKMLEEYVSPHGVELTIVPFSQVRDWPKGVRHVIYVWRVWRASRHVDIIFALDPVSVGLPAMIVSRLRRLPFVVRLGGDYAWEQGCVRFGVTDTLDEYTATPQSAPLPVRLLARLQTLVVSRAQLVIAPSEYLKNIITSWGIKPNRVQVIYSALAPLPVPEQIPAIATTNRTTIVTAGRLVPWKGISTLIDTVAALQRTHPVRLIIVGDGPDRAVLEAQAGTLGILDQVQFVGRCTKIELSAILSTADIFVLNTAYEGLSHQLLEVMALGVPIVTTPVGGNTELLTHGQDALLVPFNDTQSLQEALRTLIDNPEQAAALAQTAQVRTQEFSRENSIQQLTVALKTVYADQ